MMSKVSSLSVCHSFEYMQICIAIITVPSSPKLPKAKRKGIILFYKDNSLYGQKTPQPHYNTIVGVHSINGVS